MFLKKMDKLLVFTVNMDSKRFGKLMNKVCLLKKKTAAKKKIVLVYNIRMQHCEKECLKIY